MIAAITGLSVKDDKNIPIAINTNKDSQEICADLSLKFAQKKMPVTQMFVNKATLEDIFLELTGDVMEVTNNACYL